MPVVILEPDVASWPQHLSILQPRDVRGRLTLGLAGEHGCGPSWPGNGLRVLDKLCWGWMGGTEKHESSGGQVERDEAAVSEGMSKGERRTGWAPCTHPLENPPGGAQVPGDGGRLHLYPPQRQTQQRAPF